MISMKKAIVVKNVFKKYKLYKNSKERILNLIRPDKYGEDFYALSDIEFEAKAGEVVGFIGTNGSGKSTLSNVISGIVPETSGEVHVNGEVSLIAVAAGLKGDLSGRDNIELKLLMLGFSKDEIKTLEPEIIEFSELGQFIDQPVKSYSSGMKSKLGFSISVSVNPDIIIIDEALSVGDKAFAEKSFNKMNEFKREGKTIIFVSHSIGQMKQFCTKILWLEFGMVKEYGEVEDVIENYEKFLKKWQFMNDKERELYRKTVISQQQDILKGLEKEVRLDIDDFYKHPEGNVYRETPVSILGHIRAGTSYVYSHPIEKKHPESSNHLKNGVYYIKKQARYNDDIYYLLSTQPSSISGVIGWMKASDLSVHRHVYVDSDGKKFLIKGRGSAYDKPWGGKLNCVYEDLLLYKKTKLTVVQTDLVGNNVWHKGIIDGKEVWLHTKQLNEI